MVTSITRLSIQSLSALGLVIFALSNSAKVPFIVNRFHTLDSSLSYWWLAYGSLSYWQLLLRLAYDRSHIYLFQWAKWMTASIVIASKNSYSEWQCKHSYSGSFHRTLSHCVRVCGCVCFLISVWWQFNVRPKLRTFPTATVSWRGC